MTDKKMFGSFIKMKRTEKSYSQKDLAELLFVTEGAVSKWERGGILSRHHFDFRDLPRS